MQQLRLFPRDSRLPVVLVKGAGEEWSAVRRRLRRSQLDVEVMDRRSLTPSMPWPGAGDRKVAAVVALIGDGNLGLADLLETVAVVGEVPVIVIDSGRDSSTRRALEAGAEEVIRHKNASIEALQHAVVSSVYRRGAEPASRSAADPLTGLATRSSLETDLPTRLDVSGPSGVAVLYCDLDCFKAINDELGHDVGDEVLRGVASRLRSAVRATDLLVRLGGDEFVVVLRSRPERIADLSEHVAARIVQSFSQPFRASDANLHVTMSVGLAVHRPGESASDLVKRADSALYVAKRRGKSRVARYDESLDKAAASRRTSVEVLAEGVRRDLLDAEVSPLVDPVGGRMAAHLYRASWGRTGSTLGIDVPARRPATIAAEGSVSPTLFRWLLGHVAEDNAAPSLPGATGRHWIEMPAAVLLSDPCRLLDGAARRGADIANLVVVVDENDLVDGVAVRNALLDIARVGARVAVGGFGARTGSLSLLETHNFEAVWIDRQIVDGISSDNVRRAKMAGIAGVAAVLGQQVVIDRPGRVDDEKAALDLAEALVIDGKIDLRSRQSAARQPSMPNTYRTVV